MDATRSCRRSTQFVLSNPNELTRYLCVRIQYPMATNARNLYNRPLRSLRVGQGFTPKRTGLFKMARKGSVKYLNIAKSAQNDEFCTILSDIERKLKHYKKHFKNKALLCNCDDPRVSNFFVYFSITFGQLGLKSSSQPATKTKTQTDSERLEWFRTINIAGEELTDQELRNAVYAGPWTADAKRYFSKSNCVAHGLETSYLRGSYRQDR
jgi:hypothetical protein